MRWVPFIDQLQLQPARQVIVGLIGSHLLSQYKYAPWTLVSGFDLVHHRTAEERCGDTAHASFQQLATESTIEYTLVHISSDRSFNRSDSLLRDLEISLQDGSSTILSIFS